MEGIPATYLGRIVSKEHFRVFIYSATGARKLVESWDEFEAHMETGLWFDMPPEPKTHDSQDVNIKKTKKNKKEDTPKDDFLPCE